MTEGIIIAVLSMVGTLAGAYLANRKSSALIAYRLDKLEEKVDKHNSVIERTFKLEEQAALNRRQWFRVCRRRRHGTKLSPEWAADEGLLLPPLFFLGARDQRKHERPDPPLVPEGDGLQQSQRPGNPEGRRLAERLSPRNPGLPIC